MLADDSSQFANVLGVEVHFKREDPSACKSIAPSGSVTGAVLFHGFGASLFSFQKIMAPLANLIHGPAIALDHPGFGLTVRPAVGFDQYSTAFGAKLGMKLAQREGLDEVVFVGHSMGAYVASLAALEDGNRSRALILIAPAVPPPGEFLNEVRFAPPFHLLCVPGINSIDALRETHRRDISSILTGLEEPNPEATNLPNKTTLEDNSHWALVYCDASFHPCSTSRRDHSQLLAVVP